MSQAKVVLVTGVGIKRLGWYVVREAAKQGYTVAIQYRSSRTEAENLAREISSCGATARAFYADFSRSGDAGTLIQNVYESFGSLDVLIHCAATWPKRSLEETDEIFLNKTLQDNTVASFMCAKEAGLRFINQPSGGSIVLVSDWAVHRPYLNHAAYFAAKGSVETMTKVLAIELAARNPMIRVNAVLPGPVAVPDTISADEKALIIESTLVKRLGKPEHFVKTVFFLIENDFITGSSIIVDGGRGLC